MATQEELEVALRRLEGLGYGEPMRELFMLLRRGASVSVGLFRLGWLDWAPTAGVDFSLSLPSCIGAHRADPNQ